MASARLIRQASTRKVTRSSFAKPDESQTERDPLLGIRTSRTGGEVENYNGPDEYKDLPVYANIWLIRRDIVQSVLDPYSSEQWRSPRLNATVVRPLLEKYIATEDISMVYCLLVNRVQFIREQSYAAHYQSVNTSRSVLCEILAQKLLRHFDETSVGRKGLLLLANILIAGFEPFQNAPPEISQRRRTSHTPKLSNEWSSFERSGSERFMTALEIAIISGSKLFLSSPACQKVVDAIQIGRIVYTPTTFFDIIPDHFKWTGVTLYHPRRAPLLNQYRLQVPRTRNGIEIAQFIILLGLFFWVMETRNYERFTIAEGVFCLYCAGWILDQFASMLEHGWHVYSQNLWSFLDVAFSGIFMIYFPLRMHGLRTGLVNEANRPALDILAMGAPILIPRLAFNLFSENLVFVSLRDMMGKFLLLTLLAVWTFTGFFLSLLWLAEGDHSSVTIGKWMIWVWFGLDGTGIGRSAEFHWLFGPVLWVTFAILGNTLFLTILVSTLSNTFSSITRNSNAEIQFRRAVLIFEGVKSDALFSYFPPTNLLALMFLLPLKPIVSPRWFHKINVFLIRSLNAPLLLAISLYERYYLWPKMREGTLAGKIKYARQKAKIDSATFARWRVHGDIETVFSKPPPNSRLEPDVDEDDMTNNDIETANGDPDTIEEEIEEAAEDEAASPFSRPGHIQISESPGRQQEERRGRATNTDTVTSRKPRKLSVWSADGLEARVAGMLQDHEDINNAGTMPEVVERLSRLEDSMDKIIGLINRISDSMDEGASPAQRTDS